jgi:phosphoribosylaminoimidazolecarboxamide formyltransferase / IMP cyclohydrolase
VARIKTVLISVSDKRNLTEFARELYNLGIKIISTGRTKQAIEKQGIGVTAVSEYTETEEMLDGRVKTLHPKIHAGILAKRENEEHIAQIKKAGIELIDMVVVNLYPFGQVTSKREADLEEAVENIDIGGPTLLRAAAKNYKYVAAVCNPDQYPSLIRELKGNNGRLKQETLAKLSVEAFKHTSGYDGAIYSYLKDNIYPPNLEEEGKDFSFAQEITLHFRKIQDLRYGENPHQKGAFYRDNKITEPTVAYAKQLHGKELSFNNIMDLNAAVEVVKDFDEPTACIIKHNNPCGVAKADNLARAYKDALDCDKISAFGSIIGLNRIVDEETAKLIHEQFVECVIALGFTEKAQEVLKKKKNIRLLELPNLQRRGEDIDIKKVTGGALLQQIDEEAVDRKNLRVITKKKPSEDQMSSLLFAFSICKYVKSNAIVLSKGFKTVGIGAGQASRIDAIIVAARKAGKRSRGAVLASDAFFPKKDALQKAHKAGISSIIQPGGSIKDQEIIKEANKLKISMVFTGVRHFRH